MGKFVTVKSDFSQVKDLFEKIGAGKESLARRMGAAGGEEFRDEAQARVSVSMSGSSYPETGRGSPAAGTLRNAIYLAYDKRNSNESVHVYSISWNSKKAWWGKLVEFGYYQRYEVHKNNNGKYYTEKTQKLPTPKWIPGDPFLYPAYANKRQAVAKIMIETGRVEFDKIVSGQ